MTDEKEVRFVAVVDIGKTNAKLALHDLADGADLFVRTTPNEVRRDGPYPHFDVDGLWNFVLDGLASCASSGCPIDAISVTTHGACAALVGESGLALPILDYECDAPEAVRSEYDRARPPFAETFSPRLPNGLNLGAQLFWLERTFPDAFARARHILTYPQYWAWRLAGVPASEATSLGCHTDLWRPATGTFSELVAARGWERLFPPLRSAFAVVGDLRSEIAGRVGLGSRRVPVHCGIHDSNASLLPHLLVRSAPFAVLSTGTWIVAFAVGGRLKGLDPTRDTLANVDAFGQPVPSARFMGGREFDLLTAGTAAKPDENEVTAVLSSDVMVLPSFAPGTGPFPEASGRWTADPDKLTPGRRTAAASLYCGLIAAEALALLGAQGPVVIEGPFARNELFRETLRASTGRPVEASSGATGTTAGAALLAGGRSAQHSTDIPEGAKASARPDIAAYAERWRALVAAETMPRR